MTYYVNVITRVGKCKNIVVNSDKKLTVKELWNKVDVHNCRAMYATSDKRKAVVDIKYHYFNTDESILKLINI